MGAEALRRYQPIFARSRNAPYSGLAFFAKGLHTPPLLQQQVHQQDAAALAQGYSRGMRAVEVLAILSFIALTAALGIHLGEAFGHHPWVLASAGLAGFLAADFVSGLVHWMADTWGSTDIPVIGPALIRPFRHHHVDPLDITRHDWIETNGANCLISLPVAALGLGLAVFGDGLATLWAAAFLGSLVLWVMGTNQFHKWAHLPHPPVAVRFLQSTRLVLAPAHHARHHVPPYAKNYCITVGLWNPLLTATQFFPRLERLITRATGQVPRKDDIGEAAARATVQL